MKTMKLEKYNSSETASFLSNGGTWHEDVSTKECISWTRSYELRGLSNTSFREVTHRCMPMKNAFQGCHL